MSYIPQKERPYWDGIVNPFISYVLASGKPLSKSGLNYALSRIVREIFQRYPSYTVGSDLRAVLTDVRDEFTRCVLNPYNDDKCAENGDLPDQPNITNLQQQAQQQTPPSGYKVVSASDLQKCFDEGKPFNSLFANTEPTPVPAPPQKNWATIKVDEDNAEARHVRAIKAYAIAKAANASPDIIKKLASSVSDSLGAYLKALEENLK